jgi:hypothetical protein
VDLRVTGALSPAWALLDELRLQLVIVRDDTLIAAEREALLDAQFGTEEADR